MVNPVKKSEGALALGSLEQMPPWPLVLSLCPSGSGLHCQAHFPLWWQESPPAFPDSNSISFVPGEAQDGLSLDQFGPSFLSGLITVARETGCSHRSCLGQPHVMYTVWEWARNGPVEKGEVFFTQKGNAGRKQTNKQNKTDVHPRC